jgi:hypothetical protein
MTKGAYTQNHEPLWKTMVLFEGAHQREKEPKEDHQKPKGFKKCGFTRARPSRQIQRNTIMIQIQANPYLRMPLERVRADAIYGVQLARLAWRARDPEGAARVLGQIIEPGHEHEFNRRPQSVPADTAKPVRRKARKKPTRAKASANVSRRQPTSAKKSKSKRKRGSKRSTKL